MNKKYAEILSQLDTSHAARLTLSKNSKVLIIDGTNTYFRSFSASPALNDDGDHMGGVYGFLNSLKTIINLIDPTRVIIVFDGKGGSQKRRKLYSSYKSGRSIKNKLNRAIELNADEEQKLLRQQFIRLIEYLQMLPVTILSYDYVEADDIIAYISNECLSEEVIIYSNDRDYFQLINERISVYFPAKKKLYTANDIKSEFGIMPENFIWFKVVLGDKSDNVKGIRGIGETKFFKNFTFLGDRPFNLDEFLNYTLNANNKVLEKINNSVDEVKRNYYIMQLSDIDISGNLKSKTREIVDGPVQEFNRYQFKKMLSEDKLNNIIKNYELWVGNTFDVLNKYRNT